jgi:nucleotide-binding universal stress UspA family protein
MLSRVVVGFDGSDRGFDALALARVFSAEFDSHLIIAYLSESVPVEIFPLAAHAGAQGDAEKVLDKARAFLDTAHAEFHWSLAASPAAALYELASSEQADLIVIGSCHRSAIGRVTLGSVGERLVHGSPCAVSVAPSGFRDAVEPSLRKIGVGYVAEPEAEAALTMAQGLAKSADGQLELISGVSVAPTAAGAGFASYGAGDVLQARLEWARDSLEKASASVCDGIEITSTFTHSEPVQVLLEASERLDLLVLGSRGYGPAHHAFAGGVSGVVMRKAACPVLVVPRSALTAERPAEESDHVSGHVLDAKLEGAFK